MKKTDIHKEQLGYDLPENYFNTSKREMLRFVKENNDKNAATTGLKSILFSGVIGIVAFTFFLVQKQQNIQFEKDTFEELTIESLEVTDDKFDEWFDANFILNEV